MRLATLTLVLACAPTGPRFVCETSCGVVVLSQEPSLFSCADYLEVERAALSDGALPAGACTEWRGVTAWELPGESTRWLLGDGGSKNVGGWAECYQRRVLFSARDGGWGLAETSYLHELVHVAQRCDAPLPVDEGSDVEHADWRRTGLIGLSERVSATLQSR